MVLNFDAGAFGSPAGGARSMASTKQDFGSTSQDSLGGGRSKAGRSSATQFTSASDSSQGQDQNVALMDDQPPALPGQGEGQFGEGRVLAILIEEHHRHHHHHHHHHHHIHHHQEWDEVILLEVLMGAPNLPRGVGLVMGNAQPQAVQGALANAQGMLEKLQNAPALPALPRWLMAGQ
jgi:hypothetical protein